jgi:transcriptional regulator with XRE-family HTH domain
MIYDAKKITALRQEKRWSIAKLAREAKLSAPSVWALEHGRTKMPKHETMVKIAAALGVPVSAISTKKLSSREMADLEEEIVATFGALQHDNRVALVAAGKALLASQKPKKRQ